MKSTAPRIGLALGGGGARGLAHLGVAKALRDLGVPLHCVSGTSIGSVVGAVLAADRLQRGLDWANEPDWRKLPSLFLKLHLPRRSLLSTALIADFLQETLGLATFDEMKLPFAAVATNLATGEAVTMRSGDVLSAILASIAIPGIFEPVEREGKVLVDGGLSDPVPVDACRAMGADRVIAVDLNATPGARMQKPLADMNMLGIIDRVFTLICNRSAAVELSRVSPDCLLQPPVSDVPMMDFRGAKRMIAIGYDCVMSQQAEITDLSKG